MALGNIAYANLDFSEAVRAFDIATSLEPESITNWNNLAYALHAYGCGDQAQAALHCGLKIAPDDSNLHDSRRDLIEKSVDSGQIECPVIQCN